MVLVQNGSVSDFVLPQHHLSTSPAHSSPLEFRADSLGCDGAAHIIMGGVCCAQGLLTSSLRDFLCSKGFETVEAACLGVGFLII